MILIDTSVWIEVFRRERPLDLEAMVDLGEAVVCPPTAELFRTARAADTTIRSATDCLIATCALRHDLEVLRRDRDYEQLARVSALRVRQP